MIDNIDLANRVKEATKSPQDTSPPPLAEKPVRKQRSTDRMYKTLVTHAIVGAVCMVIGAFVVNLKTDKREPGKIVADTEQTNKELVAINVRLDAIVMEMQNRPPVVTDVVALPPPESDPVETAALRYVVNTDSTNVRAGNNTSTKIITTLKKGESVVVIGVDEESGWFKTTGKIIDSDSGVTVQQWDGGQVGFVSHKLLEVE